MASGSREGRLRDEPYCCCLETGRDGFWLARWLRVRGIEAHVIHAASVAVSREHRRAKTDRLYTEQLKRAFFGWLRGEREHCKMAVIPTLAEEDAKRPHRERETLVGEQTTIINRMKANLDAAGIRNFNPKLKKASERLGQLRTPEGEPLQPNTLAELLRDMERRRIVSRADTGDREGSPGASRAGPQHRTKSHGLPSGARDRDWHRDRGHAGAGVLLRNLRDRRAVARYASLTGSPDESGNKRREKGLARSGNARVRRGMIQLAWRFLEFQKGSALASGFERAPRTPGIAQEDDRRLGSQATHRVVAVRARWRRARGRRSPSCTLKGGLAQGNIRRFRSGPHACDGSPMTVRGGGVPADTMALMPPLRMGPPLGFSQQMRITASWSGPAPTEYKDAARIFVHVHAGSPSDRYPTTSCAGVLGAIKDRAPWWR